MRHGLRHTALTWMADSGVPLYVLQRVAGHQDPAVTARYLQPDTAAPAEAGSAFSAWWRPNEAESRRQVTPPRRCKPEPGLTSPDDGVSIWSG